MASAKSTSTTRRASSSRSSKNGNEHEVSPARWAGVAFVITAIVAAISLAMISPSQPGVSSPGSVAEASVASPTPEATTLDGKPPTAQPVITNPKDGESTTELIIPVTVEVPHEELARETLRLVIMRGNEKLKEKAKPKTPGTFTIQGVSIDPGANELTAVLSSEAGGFGPRSEPVVITVDEEGERLAIVAPENKHKTYEETVLIEGTAPVGSEITVVNKTSKHEVPFGTVGADGSFTAAVTLKRNATNRIEARSIDQAGVPVTDEVRVIQRNGKPKVVIKKIEPIRRASLPAEARVVVEVTDTQGDAMPGADVNFVLSGGANAADVATVTTKDNGKAVWKPVIEAGASDTEDLELVVTVTSAYSDDETKERQTIKLR